MAKSIRMGMDTWIIPDDDDGDLWIVPHPRTRKKFYKALAFSFIAITIAIAIGTAAGFAAVKLIH